MSSFAQWPDDKRRAAVEEGSARLDVLPVIVEKDYWVCWLLGRIFQDAELARNIVFKGGTTLSKVFAVIDRFAASMTVVYVRPFASFVDVRFEFASYEHEAEAARLCRVFAGG